VFAVVMAIAAASSWLLAVARRRRSAHLDDAVLDALGMTRSSHLRIELMRSLLVGGFAMSIALATMAIISVFMPVGEARRIEPHTGFDIDPTVALMGGITIVLVTAAIGVSMSLLTVRPVQSPSRVGRTLAAWMPGPTASIGLSNALEPGHGSSTSPTRSTLVGAALGVLVVVASATFGTSLNRFVDEPARYGWTFDAVLSAGDVPNDQGDRAIMAMADAARADADVAGMASMVALQTLLEGRPESMMGVSPGGGTSVGPTIVRGRAPATADEVAVGEQTLRRIGRSIGDPLVVGDGSFSIVGTTVLFPSPDTNSADALVLGGGLLFTSDGVAQVLGGDVDPDAVVGSLLIDLHEGADIEAFLRRMDSAVADVGLPGSVLAVGPTLPTQLGSPIEPAEVVAYRRVRMTPIVLSALLALLAAVSVSQALVLSVRRRRRELGTLRSLGFTGTQVRAAVAWQATVVGAVGLVIGLPLGVVAGRVAWARVAAELGVAENTVVPWLLVILIVPAVLLSANLVAAVPARRAVRVSTAAALRSE
jgi:hypothetical protein